jgi:hypothetical protein
MSEYGRGRKSAFAGPTFSVRRYGHAPHELGDPAPVEGAVQGAEGRGEAVTRPSPVGVPFAADRWELPEMGFQAPSFAPMI